MDSQVEDVETERKKDQDVGDGVGSEDDEAGCAAEARTLVGKGGIRGVGGHGCSYKRGKREKVQSVD